MPLQTLNDANFATKTNQSAALILITTGSDKLRGRLQDRLCQSR